MIEIKEGKMMNHWWQLSSFGVDEDFDIHIQIVFILLSHTTSSHWLLHFPCVSFTQNNREFSRLAENCSFLLFSPSLSLHTYLYRCLPPRGCRPSSIVKNTYIEGSCRIQLPCLLPNRRRPQSTDRRWRWWA